MLNPFEHQTVTTKFILDNPRCLITSDPGSGKTRSVIDAFNQPFRKNKKLLVLAPLSILEASWGDDIKKFAPELTYAFAYAKDRHSAFTADVDIVITNHDAVKWLDKNQHFLADFSMVCIDEFTAFKNKDSQRSKAALRIVKHFDQRVAMSGTPNSNSILDIWHPTLLIDDGARLGIRFYSFREAVCTSTYNGFGNMWTEKDTAQETVASAIGDINIRFELEECLDMPDHSISYKYVTLPKKLMDRYTTLSEESMLYTGQSTINAINAGVLVRKLLQLCTGSVYNAEGKAETFHKARYELVMDLVNERKHSVVAFNWRHERDQLIKLAEAQKVSYEVIDGATPGERRTDIVQRFQAGQITVLFCHPQSAGHGLTLTKANTTIWCSPTYNAEHFQQFNRRIYRAGQTQKTETILIAAKDTWETDVYKKLENKLSKMEELLTVLLKIRKAA
jgi:superfamily II DNA or RNA helicase